MKTFSIISIISIILLFGCRDSSVESAPPTTVRNLSALEKSVVSADNSFGLKLFSRINDAEQNKNVFISPFSVSMALGMALNGAGGSTLDSMKKVLEHSDFTLDQINGSYKNISFVLSNLDPEIKFQIANSVWCRNGFPIYQTFLNDCSNYFDAETSNLDFDSQGAVEIINNWVSSKTNGKITSILTSIDPYMVLYVINAIYFKGSWTYKYDTAYTEDAAFTTPGGGAVKCKMMAQKATFAYAATDQVQIIDLPYGNRRFSMTVVLPGNGIDIDQFAAGITQQKWNEWIGKLDSAEVNLCLPKFKLEYEKGLKDYLKAMGMGIAFEDFANFSRISDTHLVISEVKHKTYVEVNEEGSEAAAVTSIGWATTSIDSPPITAMIVDHPFIFAIREHKSGTILFIGKIINPSS
jgi:serine protease inhibitor